MTTRSWVQDPETGKLIPKHEFRRKPATSHMVQGDIEPFISPVTGKAITSRSDLREHNAVHGVTDSRDYSHGFLMERSTRRINEMTGNTKEARADRIALIKRALDKHG